MAIHPALSPTPSSRLPPPPPGHSSLHEHRLAPESVPTDPDASVSEEPREQGPVAQHLHDLSGFMHHEAQRYVGDDPHHLAGVRQYPPLRPRTVSL